MKTPKAEQSLSAISSKVAEAAQAVDALRRRIDWLNAERESLVFLASVEKDKNAKARITEIDSELKTRRADLDTRQTTLEALQAEEDKAQAVLLAAQLEDTTADSLRAEKAALSRQLDIIKLRDKFEKAAEAFNEAQGESHRIARTVRELGGDAQGVILPAGVTDKDLAEYCKNRIQEIEKLLATA